MLRRDRIDERHGAQEVGNHRTERAPEGARHLGPRQGRKLGLDRRFDAGRKRGIVGDQDRLGGGVVLGPGEEVGRDPIGIGAAPGEDQHLRRAGDHVDADLAEHQALGRRQALRGPTILSTGAMVAVP